MKKKPKCIIKYVYDTIGQNVKTKTVQTDELWIQPISETERLLVFKDGIYYTHVLQQNVLWYKVNTKIKFLVPTDKYESEMYA